MARLGALLVGLFAVVIGLLWITREPPAVAFVGTPPDPLAARRHAVPDPDVPESSVAAALGETASPSFEPLSSVAASYDVEDRDEDLARLESAVWRNPRDAEARSHFGRHLVVLNRAEEALLHLRHAVELEPANGAYHADLASALARLRRWSDAVEAYRHAERLLPDDPATAFNLGTSLHKSGDDAAAVDAFTRAIQLNPSEPSYPLALAISYERLEKTPEAAAAYGEYLNFAPDDADAERVRTRIAQLSSP